MDHGIRSDEVGRARWARRKDSAGSRTDGPAVRPYRRFRAKVQKLRAIGYKQQPKPDRLKQKNAAFTGGVSF
jgi:hypothetical protein